MAQHGLCAAGGLTIRIIQHQELGRRRDDALKRDTAITCLHQILRNVCQSGSRKDVVGQRPLARRQPIGFIDQSCNGSADCCLSVPDARLHPGDFIFSFRIFAKHPPCLTNNVRDVRDRRWPAYQMDGYTHCLCQAVGVSAGLNVADNEIGPELDDFFRAGAVWPESPCDVGEV